MNMMIEPPMRGFIVCGKILCEMKFRSLRNEEDYELGCLLIV
jgi:hypothetical protein